MCRAKQKPTPSIGPLRIVCIGDTHGFHRKLVLLAGDICSSAAGASRGLQACLKDVFPAPIAWRSHGPICSALAYATMQPEALPQELKTTPTLNRQVSALLFGRYPRPISSRTKTLT